VEALDRRKPQVAVPYGGTGFGVAHDACKEFFSARSQTAREIVLRDGVGSATVGLALATTSGGSGTGAGAGAGAGVAAGAADASGASAVGRRRRAGRGHGWRFCEAAGARIGRGRVSFGKRAEYTELF